MSEETVARRYSAALADVVLTSGETEAIRRELELWKEIFSANPDLQNIFSNPAIPYLNKQRLLEDLIAKTRPALTTANFLRLLQRNGRLAEIGRISDRFETVLEERSGVVAAEITSARELPDTERKAFQSNLEKLTGRRVKISYGVNKDIIGGVVTRIGSTVYDGSVKTKLETLKEQLVNG
jgi:F-type H+-transporting ATPase subunit delta